jgi:hypothetical protein
VEAVSRSPSVPIVTVNAGLVAKPWDYPWSSVHAHLQGDAPREIVSVDEVRELVADWRRFLIESEVDDGVFESNSRTGRSLGEEGFVGLAEALTGRVLARQKPGPKANSR